MRQTSYILTALFLLYSILVSLRRNERLIIVHLSDGLGNQMFQYAMGFALSVYHKAPLLLDTRGCGHWHNGFELEQVFSFPVQLAQPEDVRDLLGWQSPIYIRYIITHSALKFLLNRYFVAEPDFHYWPGIRDITPPCYMTGYWQSERYFKDVEEKIRALFTFRPLLSDYDSEIAQEISAVNSVSLHVRRGDYASNNINFIKIGLCSLSYYEAAIKYIAEQVEKPRFFVFSDDMDWVRANLKINGAFFYVDHNRGRASYNDMRLMSMCRHHIIANSSFSWWGAWLNPSKEKIVIAPKRWFAHYPVSTKDLIPDGWVRL
jgi:hypothetical protein